jgi:hypothetical protein
MSQVDPSDPLQSEPQLLLEDLNAQLKQKLRPSLQERPLLPVGSTKMPGLRPAAQLVVASNGSWDIAGDL